MQVINQLGQVQHWGLTPAVNVLKDIHQSPSQTPLRILFSGCSDIRHMLKTLCDNDSYRSIEIYLHETKKQLLSRCLIFLQIIHESQLNLDERTQLFLDIYGNALIKQRHAKYLHQVRQQLLNLIHDEKQVNTPLKNIVHLNLLKFEERDQMSEFIQSWSLKVPFDMPKLRQTRLRSMFKERYDYKNNLIDWDYNVLLTECAPIVHFYHYKEWRLTGLAYQHRFSTYCQPNRTLATYTSGRRKEQRTSCLVRGYWGDMMVSPYIGIGTLCDYHQSDLLYKKANYKYIGNSVQISEYNIMYWMHKLETGKIYQKFFKDYYRCDEETKKILQSNNQSKQELKPIKQEEENTQKIEKDEDEEDQLERETTKQQDAKEVKHQKHHEILSGFDKHKLQIYLMGMQPEQLIKPKFHSYFDVVVIGFPHSAYLNRNIAAIVSASGCILAEKANYLVPIKKEERSQINAKIENWLEEGWESKNNGYEMLMFTKKTKQNQQI